MRRSRMTTEISFLDRVKIAKPCPAAWEEMQPVDGDRVRYCDQCRLQVHNLSAMTGVEAETLLRETAGRLCVAYFARPDGTVVTQPEAGLPHVASVRRQMASRRP